MVGIYFAEGVGVKALVKFADGGSTEDEPAFSARKLYAQTYAKHGKTASRSKDASTKAYDAVLKMHGPEALKRLQAFHKKNEDGYDSGGKVPSDIADQLQTRKNQRAYEDYERRKTEENLEDKEMIPQFFTDIGNKVKDVFTSPKPPAGSVTKTERSVTVAPAKKRGGRC